MAAFKTKSITDLDAEVTFAKTAMAAFKDNKKLTTYGDFTKPGSLLGIRWGLDGQCVMVLKTDENFAPVNYTP